MLMMRLVLKIRKNLFKIFLKKGVSLNEVRDQLHKIASVRYDAQSKSVIFNSQSAPRKEVELGQGDSSLSDETSFMRMSEDYRSVRSDGDERRQKTPIKQYRGYQGPKCLLVSSKKNFNFFFNN